jgi:hypothetical protein
MNDQPWQTPSGQTQHQPPRSKLRLRRPQTAPLHHHSARRQLPPLPDQAWKTPSRKASTAPTRPQLRPRRRRQPRLRRPQAAPTTPRGASSFQRTVCQVPNGWLLASCGQLNCCPQLGALGPHAVFRWGTDTVAG